MTQARQTWRSALAAVPDSAAWVDALLARQREDEFVLQGEPAMRVAEPIFVSQAELAEDRLAVAAVLTALRAAGEAVLNDVALRSSYAEHWWASMSDPELLSLPAGYPQPFVLGRLDGVRTPAGLRFLEFNGGLPGGLVSADGAPRYLAETEVADRFAAQVPFELLSPGNRAIEAIVSAWHGFGGSGMPYVVVVLPEELKAMADRPLRHLLGLAASHEMEMTVADPGDLRFSGGRLQLAGRTVDVVVRAFFTPMFAHLGSRLDALLAALRAGSVCMITSLQSGLFGLKSLFAMVTDAAVQLDVPAHVRDAAMSCLPWTRVVRPGLTTDVEGHSVDLPEYLLLAREQLVIKPTAGYGGAGVELGWQHSEDSWRKVVDDALVGDHIAQWRVTIDDQEHAELTPGFPLRSFTADHNPLVCDGELAGYFVRLAQAGGGVTNISSGHGTVGGVFIVDEPSAEQRRRRMREVLDLMAPEPGSVADRGSQPSAREEPHGSGLSAEDLLRERPPHHGD